MKNSSYFFYLKIQKIERVCLFELSWGKGQKITAEVDYPNHLNHFYQQWRDAYLDFYRSDEMQEQAISARIRVSNIDWRGALVEAEANLMYEFHEWLRSNELHDIRFQIAHASQEVLKTNSPTSESVQVFLTDIPMELEVYPWETWLIDGEFPTTRPIQLIRKPSNVTATQTTPSSQRQGRPRILVILGDDTGLNFQAEKEAVKPLLQIADVEFVGWEPGQIGTQVIAQINDAITDEQGWDILFFAGHSNETEMTAGELSIAPNVSISMSEISPQLSLAQQRGLNVAIFNSCTGLNIAQSLIDLGFGQVMVMREPIHHRVIQEFLIKFLQGLGKYLDIYDSSMEARQFLHQEKRYIYPSSYFLPSLFCQPGAKLYRIQPFRWKDYLYQILPKPIEWAVLTASCLLVTLPPVQDMLLNLRMVNQAVYRDITAQIPKEEVPPVALVEIDTESIYRARLPNSQLHPFNRSYIAKLLENTNKLNASIVGLDFIFDTPQTNPPSGDKDLGAAVQRAVDANMWLIFGAVLQPNREVGINEAIGITKWNWTLQGYLNADPYRLELPDPGRDCQNACPFPYLISLVQIAKQEVKELPQPQTDRKTNFRTQFLDILQQNRLEQKKLGQKSPNKAYLPKLLELGSRFGLEALVDYSLPPNQAYIKVPAWQLLENPDINEFPLISKQVVLIGPSSDKRLGFAPGEPDRIPTPAAMSYWVPQKDWMTGTESLAYMIHHFVTNRLLVPIPDIWMIGVAFIYSKIAVFSLKRRSPFSDRLRLQIMASSLGAVIINGIIGLQLYISAGIVLPWLLPSIVFLAYVIPVTRRKNHV